MQANLSAAIVEMLNMVMFKNRLESPIFYNSILPQHLKNRFGYCEKIAFESLPEKLLFHAVCYNFRVHVAFKQPSLLVNNGGDLGRSSSLQKDDKVLSASAYFPQDLM